MGWGCKPCVFFIIGYNWIYMAYPINDNLNGRIESLPKDIYPMLSQIDQLKGQWNGKVGLSPQILNRLKRYALVTSAGASTRIEGAEMSDDEVRELVDGLRVTKIRERDREEVQGYIDAAKFIFDHYNDIQLTENHLKEIHQILLGYSTKDLRHRGEYKHLSNDVVARDADGQIVGVVFKTMSPLETPMAMEHLLSWAREAFKVRSYHPLLITASFVVEFLRIHPFVDGNGRLSRLITTLLMLKNGFEYVPYASMEKIIEDNKAEYYVALRKSQSTFGTNNESIEAWTRFFLNVCLAQAREINDVVSGDSLELILSKAQYEVYKIATQFEEFSIKDIEENTDIPRPTIRQAIDRLYKLDVVEPLGAGRATRYRFTKNSPIIQG